MHHKAHHIYIVVHVIIIKQQFNLLGVDGTAIITITSQVQILLIVAILKTKQNNQNYLLDICFIHRGETAWINDPINPTIEVPPVEGTFLGLNFQSNSLPLCS